MEADQKSSDGEVSELVIPKKKGSFYFFLLKCLNELPLRKGMLI